MSEDIDFMGPESELQKEVYLLRTELAQSRGETLDARNEIRQLLALLAEMQEELIALRKLEASP